MSYLVGIIIGTVLGLTGAGGSVFAVPLLMMLLGLPAQLAIGISLGAVSISALYGVLTRLKSKEIQWLPALVFALVGSMTAPLGSWLNRRVDEQWLMAGFTVLVLIVAYRLWKQAVNEPEITLAVRASLEDQEQKGSAICRINNNNPFKIGLPCVLSMSIGAIITGLLTGLFGVGGGFIIVPTLLFLTGISIKQAVATSLVVISCVSLAGFVSFSSTGTTVPYSLLAQVSLGGLMGMTIGVLTSRYVAGPTLQKTFAILMLAMAGITLITTFT